MYVSCFPRCSFCCSCSSSLYLHLSTTAVLNVALSLAVCCTGACTSSVSFIMVRTETTLWDTVELRDVQLPYSNEDSLYFICLMVHCCREHEAKKKPEQNCSLRANVVSFFTVCWLGVLSVIGRNKLACDWPD